MADVIQLLSPLIANQIAAGEVIERPASIIKELIENSLDAGSSEIIVSIKKSGNNLISVRDNGMGISKHDLPLAICQHATSKLKELSDLDNITSLGFRGEALASICAVAKVQITSRQADSDQAYSLIVDHDLAENYKIFEDAHPIGTTITVQDLFYSTPVRRRFLKADKTELIHIIDIFQKLALSNFDCSFTLIDEGKQVYKLIAAGSNSNHHRVQKIFGKAFVDNALHFCTQGHGIKLEGWLANEHYHRSQTDQQYFFLNNRIIRDKLILHAVKYVYETLIPPGRHPCYILYLTIDPDQFDINVHPTKHEVRFYDSRWIHQFITQQLSKILLSNNQEAQKSLESENNQAIDRHDYGMSRLNIPAILNKVQASKIVDSSANFFVTAKSQDRTKYNSSLGVVIADITNNLVISYDKSQNMYYLVNLATAYQYVAWQQMQDQWDKHQKLSAFYINIACSDPALIKLTTDIISDLDKLGIIIDDAKIIAVPSAVQFADPKLVFNMAQDFLRSKDNDGYGLLFKNLASLALGRLEGNLLPSEQVDMLAKLADLPYDQAKFNGRYVYKALVPADLEIFLNA